MEKKNTGLQQNILYPALGIVLTLLCLFPFFVMGEKSIITYNDQLDGELITYILNAKHLFEHLDVYPEVMNGIPVAGMMSPAPAFVLLFKIFSPFTAFMWMTVITKISAFLSVYLLTQKVTGKKWIGLIAGLAFMMTPFYPVYGLCISGQAFVWYAVLIFSSKDCKTLQIIIAFLLTVIYALTSSLALSGFGIIMAIGLFSIIVLFKNRPAFFRLVTADFLIVISYTFVNLPLLKQIINGSGFVSHKSEMVISQRSIIGVIRSFILGEDSYTACGQKIILVFVIVSVLACAVLAAFRKKKIKENEKTLTKNADRAWKNLAFTGIFILLIIIPVAIYNLPFIVELRNNSSGTLHDFNFERITWMLPVAWILLLSEAVDLLYENFGSLSAKKLPKILICIISTAVCFLIFALLAFNSDYKTTFMRMIKGSEYKQISFAQFYSEDLFKEAEKVIGRDKSEYRVISMGLLPASAAYNGFYCLDAYSNNYDVNYKHEFRKIIEKELESNEYYRGYFDDWGNRCYIFVDSYRTGINANFYNLVFEDIEVDFKAAKEMGAEYVISASPILNEETLGLKTLTETPITSNDCWYDLYIYEIE